MEYIVHHRCREISATGERVNLPYGSRFQTIGDFIATPDAKALCDTTSDMAHRYFGRNDDGKGLQRGTLTHAIAFQYRERKGPDGRRQRFTEAEIETLERDWSRFLVPDVSVILFNHDFFEADPAELAALAKAVNIKA